MSFTDLDRTIQKGMQKGAKETRDLLAAYLGSLVKYQNDILKEAYSLGGYAKDRNAFEAKGRLVKEDIGEVGRLAYNLIRLRDESKFPQYRDELKESLIKAMQDYNEFRDLLSEPYRSKMISREREELKKRKLDVGKIIAVSVGTAFIGSLMLLKSLQPQSTTTTGYVTLGDFSSTYAVALIIGIVILALFAYFFFKKRKK